MSGEADCASSIYHVAAFITARLVITIHNSSGVTRWTGQAHAIQILRLMCLWPSIYSNKAVKILSQRLHCVLPTIDMLLHISNNVCH